MGKHRSTKLSKLINSVMSKMHHTATCCGYFVLIWVILLSLFFYFFLRNNYNMLLTPQFEFFPPLDPQALCTWEGANSVTSPLVGFSCFGFVWNLTSFIDCNFFFFFENQPFPLKFVDPLEQSNLCFLRFLSFLWISSSNNFAFFLLIFWITIVCKVNPRSYELQANPIKLIFFYLKSSILILILI